MEQRRVERVRGGAARSCVGGLGGALGRQGAACWGARPVQASDGEAGMSEDDTMKQDSVLTFSKIPAPSWAPVATSPRQIVGIVEFNGRLFVATSDGVYVKDDNDVFRELKIVPLEC